MPAPAGRTRGPRSERLELADYWSDFELRFWQTDDPGFWKLERAQHFREPANDSWEAFARGDWEESLRHLEAGRAAIAAYFRQIDERGFTVRRVRVVEEPLTSYLQWELYALRLREFDDRPAAALRERLTQALAS